VEGKVHVGAAAAAGQADLRGPKPEPSRLADEVPDTILPTLAVMRLLEAQQVAVEAAGRFEV